MELEGREREHKLLVDQLHVDIKLKASIIDNLKDDKMQLEDKNEELQEEVKKLEELMKKHSRLEEVEDIIELVKTKSARVDELEELLNKNSRLEELLKNNTRPEEIGDIINLINTKSLRVEELEEQLRKCQDEDEKTAERKRMEEITVKLCDLERKLRLSKEVNLDSCSNCEQLEVQLVRCTEQLQHLITERRQHMDELFQLRHKAMLECLSEKDAELAHLEECGLKSAESKARYKALTQDKAILLNTLQKQREERVELDQQIPCNKIVPSPTSHSSEASDTESDG